MYRKLASVMEISSIKDLENTANLAVAIVNGLQCVVRRGEFRANEKVIFIEAGSVMPISKWYNYVFLKNCYYAVNTRKIMGQISEGLVLTFADVGLHAEEHAVGDDLTKLLCVVAKGDNQEYF